MIIVWLAWLSAGIYALSTHWLDRRTPDQWIAPFITYEVVGIILGVLMLSPILVISTVVVGGYGIHKYRVLKSQPPPPPPPEATRDPLK